MEKGLAEGKEAHGLGGHFLEPGGGGVLRKDGVCDHRHCLLPEIQWGCHSREARLLVGRKTL